MPVLRLLWVLVLLVTGACGAAARAPSEHVGLSGGRIQYRFDDSPTTWDLFVVPGDLAFFRVRAGALESGVVGDRGYIWSLDNSRYADIAVQATVRQTRGSLGNGFGVLCRANDEGNGYYFMISSAGQFSILKAMPGISDPQALVPWQPNRALRQGFDPNQLVAVCVDDYLSFSVNGQFLADVRDSDFDAGQVGVALAAVGQTAWATFDDIFISDAWILGG